MPVKPFTGWIAADGSLFVSQAEAETHQALLDLRQFFKDAVGDGDTTAEEVIDAVWRHRDRVYEILSRASLPTTLAEKV